MEASWLSFFYGTSFESIGKEEGHQVDVAPQEGPNDFNLPETGIRFIPCLHDACSQSSIEEAEVIRQLIPWLKKQSFRTKTEDILPVTLDDILIVAPPARNTCPGTWIFCSAENGSMWPCPGPDAWPYS